MLILTEPPFLHCQRPLQSRELRFEVAKSPSPKRKIRLVEKCIQRHHILESHRYLAIHSTPLDDPNEDDNPTFPSSSRHPKGYIKDITTPTAHRPDTPRHRGSCIAPRTINPGHRYTPALAVGDTVARTHGGCSGAEMVIARFFAYGWMTA